jgi:hypothetical protein
MPERRRHAASAKIILQPRKGLSRIALIVSSEADVERPRIEQRHTGAGKVCDIAGHDRQVVYETRRGDPGVAFALSVRNVQPRAAQRDHRVDGEYASCKGGLAADRAVRAVRCQARSP